MSETEPPTERQRYWLQHLEACQANHQTLAAYAAAHGLNVRSLYDARKRLKRQGVLPIAPGGPRFVRVSAADCGRLPTACRVLLANGAVVELTCGGEEVERVLRAVSRLP